MEKGKRNLFHILYVLEKRNKTLSDLRAKTKIFVNSSCKSYDQARVISAESILMDHFSCWLNRNGKTSEENIITVHIKFLNTTFASKGKFHLIIQFLNFDGGFFLRAPVNI